jgi:hypothetical protein
MNAGEKSFLKTYGAIAIVAFTVYSTADIFPDTPAGNIYCHSAVKACINVDTFDVLKFGSRLEYEVAVMTASQLLQGAK